jgi:hypothetical protein
VTWLWILLALVLPVALGALLMWLWIRSWTKLWAEGLTDTPPPGVSVGIARSEPTCEQPECQDIGPHGVKHHDIGRP